MPLSLVCPCGQRVHVDAELAGKKVRCPNCDAVLRVPKSLPEIPAPRAAAKGPPPFPGLGIAIGVMAILVGLAMVLGGIALSTAIEKPAGLIVFSLPGLFWLAAGGMLLAMKGRFAYPFSAFLVVNILLGTLFTTAGRSWGGPNDARGFAIVGLGFIGGAMLFQLFHAFLIRDLRRQEGEAGSK